MDEARKQNLVPKVLVVAADRSEVLSLVTGLALEGFVSVGESDPIAALDLLASEHHDLVLIDLMIPQMNGLQLARKIRDRFPGVKTMLMSEYLLSPVQLAKADTGVVGFIPKPCRFQLLVEFLNEKLYEPQTGSRGEEAASTDSSSSTLHVPFEIRPLQFAV